MTKYYYEDKNKKELTTTVTEFFERDGKYFLRLEDSIFYPQGGGQKGDRGNLLIDGEKIQIINTVKDENHEGILNVDEKLDESCIGKEARCSLDWDFRYKQMKLHTSLHLHHVLIEEACNKKLDNPKLSTIEDGYAVNKYDENAFDMSVLEDVNKRFKELIKSDIKVVTYPDKNKEGYRYWECMHHIIPCGGVHVDNLSEINDVDISVSHKKKAITIRITLK